ncbi:M23 family metallopeptidase [Inhella crocodyli]|uniref:M23 family metallopeptidase n=1 Tax=Inhella crocodyli TaxID=2499851 RepID=A0A437LH50_9BURK|nr:M23 family metallopeptidase [Inhella crocodyli]
MLGFERASLWLRPLERFAARHPRALTGVLLALLGGSGVTAFALGPLVPDGRSLPQQAVVEALPALALEDQIEALAQHRLSLVRHDQTRPGDSADSLLSRMGAFDPTFVAFLRSDGTARQLLQGRAGKRVELAADADGRVERLVARFPVANADLERTHFSRLIVERDAQGQWGARVELGRYETQVRLGSGQIETSLFAATDEAGLPDAVASQLADMFSGDIDFHRELRRGDRFSLVFEALTADGEPVTWGGGAGQVLAAEFVNAGRTHQAVWFKDEAGGGKAGYYGFDGQSKRRAFLASPMEFSRVSSGFSMRFHPILQTWRQHNGIDYAAPTGTPVRNVGDGWVQFAGRQNGYGNTVVVRHAGGKETLYAHLSRIDVRQGQRVEQGQRIGAVGATGWATGPHLHFEFRVNGRHQDPRLLARASEAVRLSAAAAKPFQAQVASARTQLAVAASLTEGVTGRD